MKTRIRSTLAAAGVAALLAVGAAPPVHAQDTAGFRPLFNGKNLDGWRTPDDGKIFFVENGEIVGKTAQGQLKKNEFLVTDRPYRNFVLHAKVKILSGNSGIQFHSNRAIDGAVAGPQVDIADGFWGVLYDERGARNHRAL
jgi:hypothetical protein